MAEDYGTVPHAMYDDLEDLPLADLGVFVMLMALANDHGLFDGRVSALARRFARDISALRPRIEALVAAKLIEFYDATTDDGNAVRVGRVVRFLGYRGQTDTRVNPSRRRESAYPLESGEFPDYRKHAAEAAEPARQKRGTSVSAPRKSRGSDAEPARKSRGSSAEPSRRASQDELSGAKRSEAVAPHGATAEPPAPDARAHEASPALAAPQVPALEAPAPAQHDATPEPWPGGKLVDLAEARETRTETLAKTRGPAPKRADFASVAGYEAARQAWLGDTSEGASA